MLVPDQDTLSRAARGHLDAQIAMSKHPLNVATAGNCYPADALTESLHWAHIAVANGGGRAERNFLAAVMVLFANAAREHDRDDIAVPHFAEALARLDALADEGDEIAAQALMSLQQDMDAEILERAKLYRELI